MNSADRACQAMGRVRLPDDGRRRRNPQGAAVGQHRRLGRGRLEASRARAPVFEEALANSGPPSARLSILKSRDGDRFKLVGQSPVVQLSSVLGNRPVFTLHRLAAGQPARDRRADDPDPVLQLADYGANNLMPGGRAARRDSGSTSRDLLKAHDRSRRSAAHAITPAILRGRSHLYRAYLAPQQGRSSPPLPTRTPAGSARSTARSSQAGSDRRSPRAGPPAGPPPLVPPPALVLPPPAPALWPPAFPCAASNSSVPGSGPPPSRPSSGTRGAWRRSTRPPRARSSWSSTSRRWSWSRSCRSSLPEPSRSRRPRRTRRGRCRPRIASAAIAAQWRARRTTLPSAGLAQAAVGTVADIGVLIQLIVPALRRFCGVRSRAESDGASGRTR